MKQLSYTRKAKPADDTDVRDGARMHRLFDNLRSEGALKGGTSVDWRGSYPALSTISLQTTSVKHEALQQIDTVGLFFHLNTETTKVVEGIKGGRPEQETEDKIKGAFPKTQLLRKRPSLLQR